MDDSEGAAAQSERGVDEKRRQLEDLAEAARQEFLLAGLPAVISSRVPAVAGVNIWLDHRQDERATVFALWRPSHVLNDASATAVEELRFDDPALIHGGAICESMIAAMLAILVSAGFEVTMAQRELVPYSLDILAGPTRQP